MEDSRNETAGRQGAALKLEKYTAKSMFELLKANGGEHRVTLANIRKVFELSKATELSVAEFAALLTERISEKK